MFAIVYANVRIVICDVRPFKSGLSV